MFIHCLSTMCCDRAYENNKESLFQTLWNLRNAMFSSIVLAFAIGAFNHLKDYRKIIKSQHYIYVDSMDDFEELFRAIVNEKEWLEFHALYNERCLRLSLQHIKDYMQEINITNNEFIKAIDLIQSRLCEIDSCFKMGQLLVADDEMLNLYISGAKKEISNVIIDNNSDRIRSLILELYNIVEQIRYPWRRDIKLDKKILVLSDDSKFDFYKRMWYEDFNPWS